MRTNKNEKQPKPKGVRSLKIQPKCRHNKWSTSNFPELILRGKWLEEFGFKGEGRVVIRA